LTNHDFGQSSKPQNFEHPEFGGKIAKVASQFSGDTTEKK